LESIKENGHLGEIKMGLKDWVLDFPKIIADFMYGYDIFTTYKYGGDKTGMIMFYPELVNKGTIPAYRVLVKTYHDEECVWEHIYSILNVGIPVETMYLYLTKADGDIHRFVTVIEVLGSIHLKNKYRVSGFTYKFDSNNLRIVFDYFTKNALQMDIPIHRLSKDNYSPS
jgi:hypothetical protein